MPVYRMKCQALHFYHIVQAYVRLYGYVIINLEVCSYKYTNVPEKEKLGYRSSSRCSDCQDGGLTIMRHIHLSDISINTVKY